mmetsp:Transcript_7565/g.10720  ORF Transcript_7565/g.10720 Transcript_7565/m.10720 type:complete len:80 (-) Transcript_7565:2212-2451(-)
MMSGAETQLHVAETQLQCGSLKHDNSGPCVREVVSTCPHAVSSLARLATVKTLFADNGSKITASDGLRANSARFFEERF